MPFVIEFISNTNYEIQIGILKTCCKFYNHKSRKHKILKAQKTKKLKNVKTQKRKKTLNLFIL
jgi:hypothetical protein